MNQVQQITFEPGDIWRSDPEADYEDAFKVTAVTPTHVSVTWSGGLDYTYPVEVLIKQIVVSSKMVKQAG